MADDNDNRAGDPEQPETVSAPEGPVAPAPEPVGDEAPPSDAEPEAAAQAETPPVEEAATETPEEPPVAEADPAPDVEAEAAAAEVPEEPRRKKKRLPRALRPQRSKPKRERSAERKPIARLPKPERERGRRQERRGVVISDAADKTIVVKVEYAKAHPKYKKVVRRSTKFAAHDEDNRAKVGDVVRIVETRPLSKTKNWRLVEVLEEAR
jgi:small subunit ribosomal protein S17